MEDKDVFILEEIVDYCDKINDALDRHGNSREEFDEGLDFQEACAFRTIQIGELVNSLSDSFKERNSEIEWRNIVAFRNIVAHDYGKIDIDKMWDTLVTDVPKLREFCVKKIA